MSINVDNNMFIMVSYFLSCALENIKLVVMICMDFSCLYCTVLNICEDIIFYSFVSPVYIYIAV